MKSGRCFWCGYTKTMTLEHIVPKACGGGEEDENKTHACEECNNDRGQVPGYYCSIVDFKKYLENWDGTNEKRVLRAQKMHRRLHKTLPKMKEVQDKWRKIEELRLGRSPTAEISLEIPEIPGNPEQLVDQTESLIQNYFRLRKEVENGNESARQEIINMAVENNLNAGCIL